MRNGTDLTRSDGNQDFSRPDQVITNRDIRGCVTVSAPGVVIKDSKISCPSGYAIDYEGKSGGRPLTLQDVTISCNGSAGSSGVGEYYVKVIRADISGCENGFDADHDVSVQDSYIHDLVEPMDCHCEPHTDGMQSSASSNLDVEHNVMYADHEPSGNAAGGTSALIMGVDGAHNSTIRHNLLAGGAYTLYCPRDGAISDFVVDANVFSRKFEPSADYPKGNVGSYGPTAYCDRPGITFTNNVYDDDGASVPSSS